nr:hypothetical protein [Anaerolineales bacterium]
LLPDREGADLDMEAVLTAAAEHGVALEVNANPQRLDLDDVHIKRALELGCLLSINTDAHHPDHFSLAHYGVGTARRGWATADNIINAWPVERLLQWLDERGHRRPRPAARLAAEVTNRKGGVHPPPPVAPLAPEPPAETSVAPKAPPAAPAKPARPKAGSAGASKSAPKKKAGPRRR